MIRLDAAPTKSAGAHGRAILLPESVQRSERDNYRFGTVVALGDPVLHSGSGKPIPWSVRPGDKVCFQFGADLTGEREVRYTRGVPHALCFAEDLLYTIEGPMDQLLPMYLNAAAVRTAVLNAAVGLPVGTDTGALEVLADEVYALLAGVQAA